MYNKTKHALTKVSVAVAAVVIAGGANAANYLWDFTSDPGSTTSTFSDASIAGTGLTAGVQVQLRAYYAPYAGGIISLVSGAGNGFSNYDPSGFGMTSPGESTTSPHHAIDYLSPNQEFVVIDACNGAASCSTVIDWSSIKIGWGIDNYGTTNRIDGQADIRLWALNSIPTDTATLGAGTVLNNLTTGATTTGNLDGLNSGVNIGPSRYLVVSGSINDAFKLKAIGGTTGSPPNQTPEPGSIALVGLGLLGFVLARRRRTA